MELTYPKYRRGLSSSKREELYDRCRGNQEFPICNLCGSPVDGTREAWDESHVGAPACFGGTDTGVAHRSCNQKHNHEVVTPMNAKANRVRQNFIGASVSSFPMRGGRNDTIKRTMSGRVVPRRPKPSFEDELEAVAIEMAKPCE
jgi:hypothetical protein